jgi:pimeloyl-ACP methyl ester carboxylesterase
MIGLERLDFNMNDVTLNYVQCPDSHGGQHRMAWWEWGSPEAAHVVVCAHGLSRQGRDFDVLARALVAMADHPVRVVCPDVVGRGCSDWLKDPMDYQIATYVGDMLCLLAALHDRAPMERLDWVGTSMGGLIGLVLAAQPGLPRPAPVGRLVLNDVGPVIQWAALQRIGTYLGKVVHFASLEQAAAAMRSVSQEFGPHTDAEWLALSRPMVVSDGAGGVRLHYDPAIAQPFAQVTPEAAALGVEMMWALYDGLRARTLLIRGADSDLLAPETARAMTLRGPKATLVEFAGVGHAPTLVAADQVAAVARFLLEPVAS